MDRIRCSNCGNEVDKNATFCPNCGNKMGISENPISPKNPSDSELYLGNKNDLKKKRKKLFLIIGSALVLIITFIAIIVTANSEDNRIPQAKKQIAQTIMTKAKILLPTATLGFGSINNDSFKVEFTSQDINGDEATFDGILSCTAYAGSGYDNLAQFNIPFVATGSLDSGSFTVNFLTDQLTYEPIE